MDFLHIFRDSWKWTTKETLQNWSLPKHQAQWSRSLHILVSLYDVRFSSKQMFGWIWSIHSYHMFLVFIVVIVVILPFIFGLQKVCQRCSVGRALLAEGISGRFEAKISVANLRERDWFDWLGRLRCLRRKRCRGGRSWRRWSGNFKMRRRRFKCSSFDFRSVESDLMTPILSWKTFVSFKWTSLVSNLSSLVLSSGFIWTLFNCKFLRPEAPGKAINFQKRGTVVLCNIVWHCAVICFFMAKTKGLELQNQISQASEQIALQLRHLRINFFSFPFLASLHLPLPPILVKVWMLQMLRMLHPLHPLHPLDCLSFYVSWWILRWISSSKWSIAPLTPLTPSKFNTTFPWWKSTMNSCEVKKMAGKLRFESSSTNRILNFLVSWWSHWHGMLAWLYLYCILYLHQQSAMDEFQTATNIFSPQWNVPSPRRNMPVISICSNHSELASSPYLLPYASFMFQPAQLELRRSKLNFMT